MANRFRGNDIACVAASLEFDSWADPIERSVAKAATFFRSGKLC